MRHGEILIREGLVVKRLLTKTLLTTAVLGLIVFLFLYVRAWFLLREYETYTPPQAATIFDRHGEVIAHLGGSNAEYVALSQVPQELREAVVAVEDRRFYRHFGLDPIRIVGAVIANIRAGGKPVQGGSTITQQVAKNAFLTPEKTLQRKLEEAVFAIVLEQRYSKEKILELYLNTSFFGQGAVGVENASEIYFGKNASELTLAESALLAGMLRAPSAYDPFRNPELAVGRRNVVLELMAEQEYITSQQAQQARETELELSSRIGGKAPFFVDYVTSLLVETYGRQRVYGSGLRVHTTLDLRLQSIAQASLQDQKFSGSLVALDPANGHILAMVGGRDYGKSQFNRAVQALRQPGSAIKPFVYATALMQGWRSNTLLVDAFQDFNGYQPQNWNDRYWGSVTMKHSLAHSLNAASVWLLGHVGIDNVIWLLKQVGITTLVDNPREEKNDRNLSLALGGLTRGVRPLELAGAYLPFANGGKYIPPTGILKVINGDGTVLDENQTQSSQIFSEQVAFLVTDMMRGTLDFGTGQHINVDRPAAAKTGSTNDQSDAWFVGYTPQLLAAVYIGHDEPAPLGGFGGTLAGPVWANFMNEALADSPKQQFPVPAGVTADVPVHIFSGLLGAWDCQWVKPHAFVTGTEPTEYTGCWEPEAPDGEWEAPSEYDEEPEGTDEEQLGDQVTDNDDGATLEEEVPGGGALLEGALPDEDMQEW